MREGKTRIETDRLLVEPGCTLKIFEKIIRPALILARAQVENVSIGIVRRLTFNLCLPLRRECIYFQASESVQIRRGNSETKR